MCRYGVSTYKPHYACFKCRKTFKRRLIIDIARDEAYSKDWQDSPAKCPECGNLMANMGLDFESPKKNDKKAWQHVENLYETGISFHSCGCTGPGYIPKDKEALLVLLKKLHKDYIEQRRFWSNRVEPKTASEEAKDREMNAKFLYSLPRKFIYGTKRNKKRDIERAVVYWADKTKQIEQYINGLSAKN